MNEGCGGGERPERDEKKELARALIAEKWEDEQTVDECFSWISEWRTTPTHTFSAMQEL